MTSQEMKRNQELEEALERINPGASGAPMLADSNQPGTAIATSFLFAS
jgi:hypothetical protein